MASAEFTDQEKNRIKHFLSYPDWSQLAQSIQLGIPAGAQPLFLVEQAFQLVTPDARDTVRRDLCECEDIECQLSDSRGRFKATRLGELYLNPDEPVMLRRELLFWTTRLADDLGVLQDPYSSMMYRLAGDVGGYNARVVG